MNSMFKSLKSWTWILAICSLFFPLGMMTHADTAPAAKNGAYVYYSSNGELHRVKSDGTDAQSLIKNFNFQGVEIKPIGNHLYFMYSDNSTTLLRFSMDGTAKIPSRYVDDEVVYYTGSRDFIYYMNSKGAIYRGPADGKSSEAKLVADMADVNFPEFRIVEGKIYYNARKSGRTTWVASKAADGSGQVQWIAQGAVPNSWYMRTDNTSIHMIVNTKPEETQYSTNCMVLYSMPKKGGAAKALNPKSPIDANALYSGWWCNGYYMFNKDIDLNAKGEYDYATGKGSVIDMKGIITQIHDKGILELANIAPNKVVFVDSAGKAYVTTISGNKATGKKALAINNAWYARNLINNGSVKATMIFAESGAFMVQPDLSLKQMVGIEWDLCMYEDDVPGFFYVNAGDNGRLYHMSDDGKTSTKLGDEKVNKIVLISKP